MTGQTATQWKHGRPYRYGCYRRTITICCATGSPSLLSSTSQVPSAWESRQGRCPFITICSCTAHRPIRRRPAASGSASITYPPDVVGKPDPNRRVILARGRDRFGHFELFDGPV